MNLSLIAIYYLWDKFWFYPQETLRDVVRDETQVRRLQFRGIWPNALLLVGVVLSIALLDPSKTLPGTTGIPGCFCGKPCSCCWC